MPSISIKWITQGDDRVCPICRDMNGYIFGPFEGEVPDSLYHPQHGEVWNKYTGSLAHEHKQFCKKYGLMSNCRCHHEHKIEAQDMLHLLQQKIDAIKGEIVDAPDYQTGGRRTTSFEDIGVDPSKYGLE